MKRRKKCADENKKVLAILTSDWHLREDTPVCRTDNFQHAQWKKVRFIKKLQRRYNCPILHAGDLYDHWKTSPWLIGKTLKAIPDEFYSVYGNHDLPQHSMDLVDKCGMYVLANTKIKALEFGYWNDVPVDGSGLVLGGKRVFVWHKCVFQLKQEWMGSESATHARKILKKYPQFDLIVTGDNHQAFVEEYKGRILVNPGPITRQSASQIDFRPRVYLWYSDNTVKPIYLPIEEGVVSRDHLEKIEARNDRIDAFISSLNNDWEGKSTFQENLKLFERKNKVNSKVIEIIYEAIDHASV